MRAAPAAAAIAFSALTLAVGACRSAEEVAPPGVELPERFGPSASATQLPPPARWWTRLGDPLLDDLVARADLANLDLEVARQRVIEARARHARSSGDEGPALDAKAGYAWREVSTNVAGAPFAPRGPTELFQVGFDAVWELDLFGARARSTQAAAAEADAALWDLQGARVTLFAEIAREYVELRTAQQELRVVRENLVAQEETLALTEVRARGGLASEFDVARARLASANTRALAPDLETRTRQAIHRLGTLLGRAPLDLMAELEGVAPIPSLAPITELGTPTDLLLRRSDVRRAERALAAAQARSKVARAQRFPSLSLAASLASESARATDLFDDGSGVFSIRPSLTAPLFRSGALAAEVRVRDAQRDAAIASYRSVVLAALREVEDATVAADRERERQAALATALEASESALGWALDLNRRGVVDFFEVLAAQASRLSAEAAVVRSAGRSATLTIAVYKALGGGWEN